MTAGCLYCAHPISDHRTTFDGMGLYISCRHVMRKLLWIRWFCTCEELALVTPDAGTRPLREWAEQRSWVVR